MFRREPAGRTYDRQRARWGERAVAPRNGPREITMNTSSDAVRAASAPWWAKVLRRLKIDMPLGLAQPRLWRCAVATIVAVVLSLAACAILVRIGTAVWPSTTGYDHFRFADYAKLTIIGVVLACLAWPIVCLLSTRARWLFFRLTIVVTVVGLAPDAWIVYKGQPIEAVAVLVAMHIALALLTYPSLVLVAPQPKRRH
ncbi:MAG: hypothetical protein JWQ64_2859 [Subtercola sp.]|nr:hypothetical protein [Subtercola sp.]